MANKINSIDEEIEKLLEKRKKLISKRENEIGKYLLSSWGINCEIEIKDIKALIDNKDIKKLANTKLGNESNTIDTNSELKKESTLPENNLGNSTNTSYESR